MTRNSLVLGLLLALFVGVALAHEHEMEDVGPYEMNFLNDEPIDRILSWHIGLQMVTWGILFPAGMVLGINKSRFHAPFQAVAVVLTLSANWLAHHHGGRAFHTTAHSAFAHYLFWYLITQTACGIFLKTHLWQETRMRKAVMMVHGFIGKSFPVVGWTQMIFGGIAALGFCFGEHLGQCIAHFAMGSAFIVYAVIMLLMMRVGAPWLARRGCSQEFIDSWVIMIWGIINTFTMHNFFADSAVSYWSHKDLQHVSLGVLFWTGGALGIFLARNGRRTFVPAVVLSMTGYAMSAHAQALEFSTTIHKVFGYSLMAAGLARLIEVCFVLKDQPAPPRSSKGTGPRIFQYLPPFLLTLSGLTFLSSTEEQMQLVAGSGMDATTWTDILFSGTFVIFLTVNGILELYERTVNSLSDAADGGRRRREGTSWFSMLSSRNTNVDAAGGAGESSHYVPVRGSQGEREPATSESEDSLEELRRTRGLEDPDQSLVFDLADDDEEDEVELWHRREKEGRVV